MMFSNSAVVAFVVAMCATSVSAQIGANSTIDPGTVLLNTRVTWCISQRNVCGTLCAGEPDDNDCDENTLKFDCTCASNSSAPGLAYYLGTIPTFVCNQLFEVCNSKNSGVASAQAKCLQDQKANCGTLDSTKGDFSSTSASTTAPSTTSTGSAGTAGAGAATTTPTGAASSTSTGAAATMMAAAGNYGSGVLVAGVAAAFGMML